MRIPRLPQDREAWDRDFQALCEKHQADAAYYVPVVEADKILGAMTGGERDTTKALDMLLTVGAAAIEHRYGKLS